MQPDIPDTTLLTMSAAEYVAKMDMAKQDATRQAADELNALRDNLRNALQIGETDNPVVAIGALVTERDNLKQQHTDLQFSYDVLSSDSAACLAENKRLAAQIAELTKPHPPEIEPVPEKPTEPEKPETRPVFPFCGIYIEDERAVNDLAQAKERADALVPAMEFAADSALTDYIFFGNPLDVKLGDLYRTAHRLKKRIWASPFQVYFMENRARCIDHLKALHDVGVHGGFVDDAQNIPPDQMPVLLNLINEFMPGAPVVCSFAADFDDSAYPRSRYIDSRQWFLRSAEKEGVYFPKWETAQDAQIYTADCWKRGGGFMHTPERITSMFRTAMPFVQGVAFYSLVNTGKWDHVAAHKAAIAKDANALTVWSAIKQCSHEYQVEWADDLDGL